MNTSKQFTHFDLDGAAHMVDVGDKESTHRVAIATGIIRMQKQTLDMILEKGHKKGDVLGIARVAGIMGAKRTSDLVPLCHLIAITKISIDFIPVPAEKLIRCSARVETRGQTGVEIEALNAVQLSLLTIYDMCKAVDRGMVIDRVALDEKSGGRSGHWKRSDLS